MSTSKIKQKAHPREKKECGHCHEIKDIDIRCTYCSIDCQNKAKAEKVRLGLIEKARSVGATPPTTATQVELKKLIKRAEVEIRREEKEADKAITGALFIAETIEQAQTTEPPVWSHSKRGKLAKKQNYAVAMLSDTHFDEKVYPEQIQGINAYGRDIGDMRIKEFFHNVIELSDEWLTGLSYDGLILPLGGDIFTGYIHEELRENLDAPIFESMFHYGDMLISGIKMLRDYFGHVKIPAVVGNHGRLDRKPRSKFKVQDSYDWALYQYIKHHFEVTDAKGIEFMIAESADQMFSVYDTSFCLTHGDQFRGGAGISGIHTPLAIGDYRKRRRLGRMKKSYEWLLMGHWHQWITSNGIIVNGSLIGYNEYAFGKNLDYDSPKQAFFLVDPEHGVTINAPIHVSTEREVWKTAGGKIWDRAKSR